MRMPGVNPTSSGPPVAQDRAGETCTVVETPDVDHGMVLPDDVVRGAEARAEVARSVDHRLASKIG